LQKHARKEGEVTGVIMNCLEGESAMACKNRILDSASQGSLRFIHFLQEAHAYTAEIKQPILMRSIAYKRTQFEKSCTFQNPWKYFTREISSLPLNRSTTGLILSRPDKSGVNMELKARMSTYASWTLDFGEVMMIWTSCLAMMEMIWYSLGSAMPMAVVRIHNG
jgi:hypothetical protein